MYHHPLNEKDVRDIVDVCTGLQELVGILTALPEHETKDNQWKYIEFGAVTRDEIIKHLEAWTVVVREVFVKIITPPADEKE